MIFFPPSVNNADTKLLQASETKFTVFCFIIKIDTRRNSQQSCTGTVRVWNKLFQAVAKLTGCQKEKLLFCLPRQSLSARRTTV